MYKCYPYSVGVQIIVSAGRYVLYSWQTHQIIDNGDGTIKMQRKSDGLYEFLIAAVTDFTDLAGVTISNTFQGLQTYLDTHRELVAGEGVAVDGVNVSLTAGGPSTLGGFKVGTGLTVDGFGRLSASASSEITRILNTEAEMLALPTEELRSYRVIRLDTKRLYYTNAGAAPSVLANWFVGPSIEASTLSFKGRSGAVEPEFADYNFELVPLIDKTTSVSHKLVVDDGKLYIENIATADRVRISYSVDTDTLIGKVSTLETLVSGPTGLVSKLDTITQTVNSLGNAVNNTTTGLLARVQTLENAPGNGQDYGSAISVLQAKEIQQDDRLTGLETLANSTSTIVTTATNKNTEQDSRLTSLETLVNTATSKNVAQDGRLTTLESQTAGIAAIKSTADAALPASQKGVNSGVAPLGADGKVPAEFLPSGSSVTPTPRIWSKPSGRNPGVWVTNNSGREMLVYLRGTSSTSTTRYIRVIVRNGGVGSDEFDFRSYVDSAAGSRWPTITVTVPIGGAYYVATDGGSTSRATFEYWNEMY